MNITKKNILLIVLMITTQVNLLAQCNTWSQKKILFSKSAYFDFSLNGKGYVGGGLNLSFDETKTFYEYDPVSNIWQQLANFGGGNRAFAVGFSIGNKGYAGTGHNGTSYKNDFWEYNRATNLWTKKANYSGGVRSSAVAFSIGNKGYIGTGWDGSFERKDFWEYNPATNIWTKKADIGNQTRFRGVSFVIEGKGYVGLGISRKDFWRYDPVANTWTEIASTSKSRSSAASFGIGRKGYIGTGNGESTKDFWEYDPGRDEWTYVSLFPGRGRVFPASFVIGHKGYMGFGRKGDLLASKSDFWEFTPGMRLNLGSDTISIILGDTAQLGGSPTADGVFYGYEYDWTPGDSMTDSTGSNPKVFPSVSTYYFLSVTDSNGCVRNDSVFVKINNPSSIKVVQNDAISVYPNPSGGIINISLGINTNSPSIVTIISVKGDVVFKGMFNESEFRVNLEGRQTGIYMLQIESGENKFFKKLLIH